MKTKRFRLGKFMCEVWQGHTGIWFCRFDCPHDPNPWPNGWRGETKQAVIDAAKSWQALRDGMNFHHPYMRH